MTNIIKKVLVSLVVVFALSLAACSKDDTKAKLTEVASAIQLGDIEQVDSDLVLPTSSVYKSTITWTSSDTDVITNTGEVHRPANGDGDAVVDLKATITIGKKTLEKTFQVKVLENDVTPLQEAANSVVLGDLSFVEKDLELPTEGINDATIVWATSDPSVITDDGTVTRPRVGRPNAVVDLYAMITVGDQSMSKHFRARVIAEPMRVKGDVETIIALPAKTPVKLLDVTVFAIQSGSYFVMDSTGSVNVYSAPYDGIKIGDVIQITGTFDKYNGQPEITNVLKVDVVTPGTGTVTMPTPTVMTIAAVDALDTSKTTSYAKYVTVTGKVTIEGQYDDVMLGDADGHKLTVYYKSDADAIADYEGQTITVNVLVYQNSNGWRVTYDKDVFGNPTPASMTDAEYLTYIQNKIIVAPSVREDFTLADGASVALAAPNNNATITWTSDNAAIAISGTSATITRPAEGQADVSVKLTAHIVVGSLAAVDKEYTVVVKAQGIDQIGTILTDYNANEAIEIKGIVTGVVYKGFYLYDGTGTIYVFVNATPTVAYNDKLDVKGTYGIYSGEPEVLSPTITTLTDGTYTQPTPTASTIADIADSDTNVQTNYGKYVTITGTATKCGAYSNYCLVDDDGNYVQIYYKTDGSELAPYLDSVVTINAVTYQYSTSDHLWIITYLKAANGGVTLTDEVKQGIAKDKVENMSTIVGTTLTLPTVDGVTIAWTSSNTTALAIAEDGTVTVTRSDADVNVTLTAVITIGEQAAVTVTKDVVVKKTVPTGTITIADARGFAVGDKLTINGTITAIVGKYIYVQDNTAGIVLYNSKSATGFAVNKLVTVTGTLDNYNGLIQLKDFLTSDVTIGDASTVIVNDYYTIADLLADNTQGKLVSLKGMEIVSIPSSISSGGDIVVTDEVDTIVIRIDSSLKTSAAFYYLMQPGNIIDITAPVGYFNGAQLMITSLNDIQPAE